jgi:hypothetical protein
MARHQTYQDDPIQFSGASFLTFFDKETFEYSRRPSVNTAKYKFQEMKKDHDRKVVLEARERNKTTIINLSVLF